MGRLVDVQMDLTERRRQANDAALRMGVFDLGLLLCRLDLRLNLRGRRLGGGRTSRRHCMDVDNLGSPSVGPWQAYAAAAFNSYLRPGDTLALNLSTIANDPRQVGFGRLSYDTPVGVDGVRSGASALYSVVRPGDDRRLYPDRGGRNPQQDHPAAIAALHADADGGGRIQRRQGKRRVRHELQ